MEDGSALVYALFIAVAAFGVANALFHTTWLNVLVTVILRLTDEPVTFDDFRKRDLQQQ